MASLKVEDLPNDARDLPSGANRPSRCGPDVVTEELLLEPTNATVKAQKPGKFRRTALTFFGVRRSICILPSFFGGRSKNQSKWASKKGMGKSKTHDGLSKVGHDGDASAGDFEFGSQRAGDLHGGCHHECSHPAADHKSLSLGRQRKGLRGLFQSFKHHRSQRNDGQDKTETAPASALLCRKEVPVVRGNATECLGPEADVPEFLPDVACEIPIGLECSGAGAIAVENGAERESPNSQQDESPNDACSGEREAAFCPRPRAAPDPDPDPDPPPCESPAGSADRLNLLLEDVASLKSFDSLTGCGDMTAEREDDSVTESSVSGERSSRTGGKRASCYLTYQGGGEEMASPEDLDESCLRDFWEINASEEDEEEEDDVCCGCDPDRTELTGSHTLNNSSTQAGVDSSSTADVLTPQSEHQESVPNSDEGYYDSTTPGPEEGQDRSDRPRPGRMARDSYSGDALYELFAPDESLVSPRYENAPQLPGSKPSGDFSAEPLGAGDSAYVPEMSRLQIGAELYGDGFLETCDKSPELSRSSTISKPQTPSSNNGADLYEENGEGADRRTRPETLCSPSFGSTSDPDFETFCEPKEESLEENKPVALPYRNAGPQPPERGGYRDDRQAVSFSQALVDYTKHTQQMLGLEASSALTPNMEALPAIVTFDVVDMHNEGEYDEQIHMELEEDISSPYQEFEESYLQKDAFAECDYQMLELYEQNLISNTWAVASLPRHLGLTKASPPMPHPLSLDRRSRSLDTESLELKRPETYRDNRAATVSRPQTEKDSERESPPYYQKNVVVSASAVGDSNSIMALSWQTRSDVALSLPLTDEEITDKVQSLAQAQARRVPFPRPSRGRAGNGQSASPPPTAAVPGERAALLREGRTSRDGTRPPACSTLPEAALK
ncbi:APC membrane recruitment protein 1 [Menidia menidia]